MKTILTALLVAGLVTVPAKAEIFERILVKVNGEIFTKTQLEERQIFHLRQQGQLDPRILENEAELERLLGEITPRLLVEVVNEMLLLQRGRELGYRVTEEQFRSVLENIRRENQIETEEQFQEALRNEGLTMEELRQTLETQMVIQRVQQMEVLGRIGLTEQEAQTYYAEHADEFATRGEVMLREILVSVPAETGAGGQTLLNVARDDEARARAEEIRERILGGGDFAQIASRESDAPSAANGGLVGPVDPAELAPVFRDILDALDVGGMSEVVRTPRGYQLLRLESRTEAAIRPFEEVRDQIAERVFEQKRLAEYRRYLDRLREQAIIEWRSDEARAAYEQGLRAFASQAAPVPSEPL